MRLVDSFNLTRRMGWCRINHDEWPTYTLASAANALGPAKRNPAGNSFVAQARRLSPPMTFLVNRDTFARVQEVSLASVGRGEWLVESRSGEEMIVLVRAVNSEVLRRVQFSRVKISDLEALDYQVLAKKTEQ